MIISKSWRACLAAAALVAAGATVGAAAQEQEEEEVSTAPPTPPVYFAIDGGLMHIHEFCDFAAAAGREKCDDVSSAFRPRIGYKFSDSFSLQAGGVYSRRFEASGRFAANTNAALRNQEWGMRMRYRSIHAAFVGRWEINRRVSFTGMAGAHYWKHKFRLQGNVVDPAANPGALSTRRDLLIGGRENEAVDYAGGAGMQLHFSDNFASEWQWTRYVADNNDADFYSVGLSYQF